MSQQTKHLVETHNLPRQLKPFVGRKAEMAEIATLLADPACRLLTLVGPGGIGKTRLAIEVASKKLNDLRVCFVNLQPVRSAGFLVSALADALGFTLSGQGEPQVQLFNYLRDKEMLLILDNFEHLPNGAKLLTDLLRAAPNAKLLITSREALNLQEEWLFPISGLPFPGKGKSREEIEIYEAVQLLITCARRVRPDFSLVDEKDGVIRICQLVEGMPLALELAASWVKTLSCAEIAAEIRRNVDFLATSLRNVPAQHRSIQAVFDQSWQRLSQNEQSVFKRLSVFRGGFDRKAAKAVAGASLLALSSLLDKSLLRREPDNRYQIHELTRQYANDQLEQTPQEAIQTRNRFGRYYIAFMQNLERDLIAGRQKEATLQVKTELENVRAAWLWAIETGNVKAIEQSVMALSLFYQYQSRYVEGNLALEQTQAALRKQPPSPHRDQILVSVLCDLGWLRIRLGKIEKAEQGLLESIALLKKHRVRPTLAHGFDPRIPLGVIASIWGDYATTARLGEEVLQESQSRGEIWNEQFSYYLLTRAAILEGDLETAQSYAQQTYQLAKQNQDHWFMAYCLNELGNVANALGDCATAGGHFQASYQLRKEFSDPEGMAIALNYLGEIALKASALQEAQVHFQHSREIYQEINDQGGLATALNGLAQVALAQGDFAGARQCFLAALQISAEIHYHSLTTTILTGIAKLLIQVGELGQVPPVLAWVVNHPANERETVELAREIARKNNLDVASTSEQRTNIDDFINHLLVWLPTCTVEHQLDAATPSQALIDPLTDRELEVLRHIADGLTNQQIAETLIISPGTAKWYTSQIYSKLGVKKRTQSVAKARELGLLD